VTYGNLCTGKRPTSSWVDNGIATVRYCPAVSADSCECTAQGDGLTLSVPSSVAAGGDVTRYTVVLSNTGAKAVTGATFSIEPSAGVRVRSVTGPSGSAICDYADPTVNVCRLSSLPAGSKVQLTVMIADSTGHAPQPTFSVTPQASSGSLK
jgi:uncharacterized repeat protein (TIGR01451 family)